MHITVGEFSMLYFFLMLIRIFRSVPVIIKYIILQIIILNLRILLKILQKALPPTSGNKQAIK